MSVFEKTMTTSTDARRFNLFFPRHFQQFAAEEASGVAPAVLSDKKTQTVLAWLIRHFIPHLKDDPAQAWQSMLSNASLVDYATPSDLAFVTLVLEQHVMQWRELVLFELNTGKKAPQERTQSTDGLLYKAGLASKPAKNRFDALSAYFYTNFYRPSCPEQKANLAGVQAMLDRVVRHDTNHIHNELSNNGGSPTPLLHPISQVQNDILHRVFFRMHF